MSPTGTITTTSRRDPWEERLDAWLYRNRATVGPPAVAAGLVAAAAATRGLARWWPSAPVWLAGVCLLVLALGLNSASGLPVRSAHTRWWRRQEERLFAVACWLLGCGWTAAAAWWGVSGTALLVLAVAGLPLAILWSRHRRVRRGVEVDRKITAWGSGDAVGLPGTRARGVTAGEGFFTYRIKSDVKGRYTLADFRRARARVAALHGVRVDAVTVDAGCGEGDGVVTVREEQRQTVEFAAGSRAEPISLVAGPRPFGQRDNGAPLPVALFLPGRGAQHGIGTGASGSGKSSLANRVIAELVQAREGLAVIADFSPGAQELRAWAPAAHAFITTVEDMDRLVTALLALCEYRGGTSSSRLMTPDERHKQVGVTADEIATYFAPEMLPAGATGLDVVKARALSAQRRQRHEQVARLARKYGVSEWFFTQLGIAEALGGTTSRDQLSGNGYAFGFHAPKNDTGHLVIPAGHGLRVSTIPRSAPGTCGALGPTWDGLAMARIEYLTDDDIRQTAEEWADRQGDLLPGEISAMDRATDGWWSARPRTAPGGGGDALVPATPPGGTPVVVTGRKRMGSADESRELVWQALAAFPMGARRAEIAERCGKSADLVGARLAELADEGRAERPKARSGRWRALEKPVQRPDSAEV